jgi:carboxymethylenebutenolidase
MGAQVTVADAHVAGPLSGPGAGVLVPHAWWGLNGFIRELCDRLAEEGFVALAPDCHEGRLAATVGQAEKLRKAPRREPAKKIVMRAAAQLAADPAVGGTPIGTLGLSMGAYWALWLAQRPKLPIAAAIAFYGTHGGDYAKSQAALQVHLAETDAYVSATELSAIQHSLQKAGRVADIHVYPGTGHRFFEQDRPDAYDAAAADLAWRRTLTYLRQHLRDDAGSRSPRRGPR